MKKVQLLYSERYSNHCQLGDAKWWLFGYEPLDHEICMETLREMKITEQTRLNHISRFRKIRHDANYRGYRVTISQAEEIIDFWGKCGKEIASILLKQAK